MFAFHFRRLILWVTEFRQVKLRLFVYGTLCTGNNLVGEGRSHVVSKGAALCHSSGTILHLISVRMHTLITLHKLPAHHSIHPVRVGWQYTIASSLQISIYKVQYPSFGIHPCVPYLPLYIYRKIGFPYVFQITGSLRLPALQALLVFLLGTDLFFDMPHL